MPVFNEEKTLKEIISKVSEIDFVNEIVCVNDGSTDESGMILDKISRELQGKIFVIHHKHNTGKGAAVISGLEKINGEFVIIQDADLEYDPSQYGLMLKLFENKEVKVVYGSRNINKNPKSSFAFYWGGIFLSVLTNVLYGSNISDESTCYKMFRTDFLKELNLKSKGFDFCPEVTAKVLKRKVKIYEVPISYTPRLHNEGKKIRWHDGLKAIWTLVKFRF